MAVIVILDIRSEHIVSERVGADKLYHFLDHFIDYYFTALPAQRWLIVILREVSGGGASNISKDVDSMIIDG